MPEMKSLVINDVKYDITPESIGAAKDDHGHNISSLTYLGENITGSAESDTTEFWADKESGRAWFSADNMLVDQPSTYGILISYCYAADVFQIFRSQPDGPTYWRSGNSDGWSGTWAEVYDSNNPRVLLANGEGIFVTESNIEAHYMHAEWFQTTADTHLDEPAGKIAVLDGSGWIYHRTPAEILSDIGADRTHVGTEAPDPSQYKFWVDTDEEGGSTVTPENVYTKDEIDEMLTGVGGATIYETTIGTEWVENEDTGVLSQNVPIEGITAANTAKVDHAYTGDGTSESYEAFVEAENQFLTNITNGYAVTYDGGITFHIFGDPNTVEIPIIVEVV